MTRTQHAPASADALLASLPAMLRGGVANHWQRFLAAADAQGVQAPKNPAFLEILFRVWSLSDFVAQSCVREPALLADLLESGDLLTDYRPREHLANVRRVLREKANETEPGRTLRRFRRREMVRIAWRDLAGWADLEETLGDLSSLAEASLQEGLRILHAGACAQWGEPHGGSGAPQQLVVLAMGKLGARELNFSSDIDLIFAFPESGSTVRATARLDNEAFFTRLGRRLIDVIGAATDEGFVFRVDLRLRPFGTSGPLVMSFDAMEAYYQSQAREWERYAMVKARPVAGDLQAGERLLAMLRPFVYRRYLDYGAFESLREMKALINAELTRKGMGDNIKLGPGGIREIEFIGQAFQLIRGGREPELQERSILWILECLAKRGYLPAHAALELREAYRFLRSTENRLQAYADRQTHLLPEDEVGRLRLARAMRFPDWAAFLRQLDDHRDRVHGHFQQTFATPQGEPDQEAQVLSGAWQEMASRDEALAILTEAGYEAPAETLAGLARLRNAHACRALSRQGRARLDRLVPLLLAAAAGCASPSETLQRLLALLSAILRRTSYLALLADHPLALSQGVRLAAASPWIVRLLSRYPLLLDELLDPRRLYAPLDRAGLEQELELLLDRVDADDLEQQMERLRQFASSNALRVAAAEVTGVLPLMKVSDHLTAIAEVVLGRVLRLAWQQLEQRYGPPRCRDERGEREPGFAVVAYGKLGGIELGYGSDLDLVFLHDSAGEGQRTRGQRAIDNAVFFARLGQRMIHMLNTQTPAGLLYEVDMRLRPSGRSGLLVARVDAFGTYQRNEAWTWEHQALVRARVVAGDVAIARRFDKIRADVLGRPRNADTLCGEVVTMRERMRAELSSHEKGMFDLKQDLGGIADIEFMVQYGVLRWAWRYPELLRYTDNIRVLETLAKTGLMSHADSDLLSGAYRQYRAAVHRNTLQDKPARVPEAEFAKLREGVRRIWACWMDSAR